MSRPSFGVSLALAFCIICASAAIAHAQDDGADSDASADCPSQSFYVYEASLPLNAKTPDGKVNLYGKSCVDTKSGEQAAVGTCVGANDCKAKTCGGGPCKLPTGTEVQTAGTSVQSTPPTTQTTPPGTQPQTPNPAQQSTLPSQQGSILEQVMFNPTPVSEQPFSPSADNVSQQIETIGQSSQPDFIQKAETSVQDFFSGPSEQQAVQLEGGGTPAANTSGVPGGDTSAQNTFAPAAVGDTAAPSETIPSSSPCGELDLICKAQTALGYTPTQEDSSWENKTATIYYPGCVGGPAGCDVSEEGGLYGTQGNRLDTNLTVAAGPNSGLNFGDVIQIRDPLSGTVTSAVVGDACPGCGSGIDLTPGVAATMGLTQTEGTGYFDTRVVTPATSYSAGLQIAGDLNSGAQPGNAYASVDLPTSAWNPWQGSAQSIPFSANPEMLTYVSGGDERLALDFGGPVPLPEERPEAADLAYQTDLTHDINISAFPVSPGVVEQGSELPEPAVPNPTVAVDTGPFLDEPYPVGVVDTGPELTAPNPVAAVETGPDLVQPNPVTAVETGPDLAEPQPTVAVESNSLPPAVETGANIPLPEEAPVSIPSQAEAQAELLQQQGVQSTAVDFSQFENIRENSIAAQIPVPENVQTNPQQEIENDIAAQIPLPAEPQTVDPTVDAKVQAAFDTQIQSAQTQLTYAQGLLAEHPDSTVAQALVDESNQRLNTIVSNEISYATGNPSPQLQQAIDQLNQGQSQGVFSGWLSSVADTANSDADKIASNLNTNSYDVTTLSGAGDAAKAVWDGGAWLAAKTTGMVAGGAEDLLQKSGVPGFENPQEALTNAVDPYASEYHTVSDVAAIAPFGAGLAKSAVSDSVDFALGAGIKTTEESLPDIAVAGTRSIVQDSAGFPMIEAATPAPEAAAASAPATMQEALTNVDNALAQMRAVPTETLPVSSAGNIDAAVGQVDQAVADVRALAGTGAPQSSIDAAVQEVDNAVAQVKALAPESSPLQGAGDNVNTAIVQFDKAVADLKATSGNALTETDTTLVSFKTSELPTPANDNSLPLQKVVGDEVLPPNTPSEGTSLRVVPETPTTPQPAQLEKPVVDLEQNPQTGVYELPQEPEAQTPTITLPEEPQIETPRVSEPSPTNVYDSSNWTGRDFKGFSELSPAENPIVENPTSLEIDERIPSIVNEDTVIPEVDINPNPEVTPTPNPSVENPGENVSATQTSEPTPPGGETKGSSIGTGLKVGAGILGGGVVIGGIADLGRTVSDVFGGGGSGGGSSTTPPPSTTPSTPTSNANQTPPAASPSQAPIPVTQTTVRTAPLGSPVSVGVPQSPSGGFSGGGIGGFFSGLLSGLLRAMGLQQPLPPTSPYTPTPLPPTSNPGTGTSTPPAPVVNLIANPQSIGVGHTSRLAWSSLGTTQCTVSDQSGAVVGQGNPDGATTTLALATSTVFTALCTGTGASASSSVVVVVQ